MSRRERLLWWVAYICAFLLVWPFTLWLILTHARAQTPPLTPSQLISSFSTDFASGTNEIKEIVPLPLD